MQQISFANISGVILAAGRGDRMGRLGSVRPKPLLPVGNRPIMEYQLDYMVKLGINDIIIVVGHLGEQITSYFGNGSRWGITIRYVEQKERLGIAHAVGQLEKFLDRPFMLFLGDIFMIPKDLNLMLDLFCKRGAKVVLATKRESDCASIRKNFAVVLHESGLIRRVIEKPRYMLCDRKGCGIYLFDSVIFDAIRRTPRTAMRDEYEITTAIQKVIDDGFPVYDAEVVNVDMNITTLDNLLECNKKWLEYMGIGNLIAQSTQIHPGSSIHGSLLGENVVIAKPITVRNSVIFDNVKIFTDEDIVNSVCYENRM